MAKIVKSQGVEVDLDSLPTNRKAFATNQGIFCVEDSQLLFLALPGILQSEVISDSDQPALLGEQGPSDFLKSCESLALVNPDGTYSEIL